LSVCLSVCLPVCLSVCLPVFSSVCLSVLYKTKRPGKTIISVNVPKCANFWLKRLKSGLRLEFWDLGLCSCRRMATYYVGTGSAYFSSHSDSFLCHNSTTQWCMQRYVGDLSLPVDKKNSECKFQPSRHSSLCLFFASPDFFGW